MDRPAQFLFVHLPVKTMARAQLLMFVIGRYSSLFLSTHLTLCDYLLAQAHGTAVFVKYVRNNLFIFIYFLHCSHLSTAVCNPSCLNGGNCTAPNTCFCKSTSTITRICCKPISSLNVGDTNMWGGAICQTR